MDCRTARQALSAPEASRRAAARGHLLACPACRERLEALAAAALSPAAEVLSCAECQARLWTAGGDVDSGAEPLVAAHLATCAACAAEHAAMLAALAGLGAETLPPPPRLPAPDLGFLPPAGPGGVWWGRVTDRGAAASPSGARLRPWALTAGLALVLALVLGSLWLLVPGGPARWAGRPAGDLATATAAPGVLTAGPPSTRATEPQGELAATTAAATPGPSLPGPTVLPSAIPIEAASTSPPPATATPVVIALAAPEPLPGGQGRLLFTWAAPALAAAEVFDLRVCRGSDCQPDAGLTNVREMRWDWCPDQGAGTYRWQVLVIDAQSKAPTGPASAIGAFDWSGGACAEGSRTRPPPTPDETPTPGPEP